MKQWFLETKGDAEVSVCIDLTQAREYKIGRRKDFDIVSPNPLVSRKHGIITVTQDGKVYIKDLKSANGTYVNDNQIEPLKNILLEKDDLLGIGAPSDAIEPKKEIFWLRCKTLPCDTINTTVLDSKPADIGDCDLKKSTMNENEANKSSLKSEPMKSYIKSSNDSLMQEPNTSSIKNNLSEKSFSNNENVDNFCSVKIEGDNNKNSDLKLNIILSIKSEPSTTLNDNLEQIEIFSNEDVKPDIEHISKFVERRKENFTTNDEIIICSDDELENTSLKPKEYPDIKIKSEFKNNSFTQNDDDDIIILSDDDDEDIFPKSQLFDVKQEPVAGTSKTSGNISPSSDEDHNHDNIFNIIKNEVEEYDNYNEHHEDDISDDDCYIWYNKLSQSQEFISAKKKISISPDETEKDILKLNDKDLPIFDEEKRTETEKTLFEKPPHETSNNENDLENQFDKLNCGIESTDKQLDEISNAERNESNILNEISHSTTSVEKSLDEIDALELIDRTIASLSKSTSTELKDKEATVKEKDDSKKYVKPPVIDAPYLIKGKRKASVDSNSKESKPSNSKKKKNAHEDIPLVSSSVNTVVQSSVLHIDKSVKEELEKRNKKRRKSVDTFDKTEKIKIQEDRKKKLKEIATKISENKIVDDKKEKSQTKPKVKQSNSRGLFLTATEPVPSTSKSKANNVLDEGPPKKRVFKIPKRTNSNNSTNNHPSKLSFTDLSVPTTSSTSNENTDVLQNTTNQNTENNEIANNIHHSINNNVENQVTEINSMNSVPTLSNTENKSTKKVRFKEEPEIRYIERIPGNVCRKVNSKDAPVPVMTITNPNHNKDMETEILSTILEWHPSWLEEQRKFNESPQVSRRKPLRMLSNFNSVGDYFNIVSPLMLLELWRYVFKDWVHNNSPVKLACIESIKNGPAGLYLNCYCLAEKDDFTNYPKNGDLLLAEFYLADNNSKIATTKKFGYVIHVNKRRMIPQDVVHKQFIEMGPVPKFKISFTMIVKKLVLKILQEKLMRIRFVSRIIAPLRIFRPIFYLQNSALKNFILKPTVQDYKISKQIKMKSVLDDNLNTEQMMCVYEAYQVCCRQSPGLFLIQGPPGTGKSFVIKNLVRQLLCEMTNKKRKKIRILLCAPSNGAIDEITNTLLTMRGQLPKNNRFKMIRLGPPGAITNCKVRSISVPELVQKHIQAQQNNNVKSNTYMNDEYNFLLQKANTIQNKIMSLGENCSVEQQKLEKVQEEMNKLKYNSNLHQDRKRLERDTEACYIKNADIICTTLSSCIGSRLEELVTEKSIEFTCCIIDEATQSGEQECLIPLTLGINKYVLVGDPQQLPPTTISQEAKDLGHGKSLFSRIQNCFDHFQDNPIRMLTEQYRMHPEICRFPSNFFYEGKLITSSNTMKNVETVLDPCRLFCLNTNINYKEGEYLNKTEADLVLLLTDIIIKRTKYNVGIITPYSKQKDYLLTKYKNNRTKENDREDDRHNSKVVINTVDGFQGQERDVIIISSVRYKSNVFLNDAQRLNVALTRAKHGIFICAHYNLFKTESIWQKLESDAKSRNFFYSLTENDVTDQKYISKLILKR